MLEFSNTALPFSKIPDYIKENTNEEIKLEEEIEKLKSELSGRTNLKSIKVLGENPYMLILTERLDCCVVSRLICHGCE